MTDTDRSVGGGDAVKKGYRTGVTLALAVIASFVLGVSFGESRAAPATDTAGQSASRFGQVLNRGAEPNKALSEDVDFDQFWEVWDMVKEKHVKNGDIQDIKLFYGAIAGMVGSLGDPYSVYFDPEFAAKFASELEGTFEGIGAEIGIKNDQLTVIAPLPGTPAEKAGLMAGDRIFAIDGMDTIGMAVEDAVTRIRGEKGTEVKLLIGRDGLKEAKEVTIVRGTIVVESVKWEMRGKVGVITISHFNEQVESKFNAAVRAILMQDPDGVVLDLRNDPGGFLDTAVTVAGEWIHDDTVVIEKFSDGTEHKYVSDGLARLADVPTVVLVNGGSASASEIVAGALQDHGKAAIVGEKTFGKGSVQDYVEFPDTSALKLTVALWYTPADRSIDKEGIEPDVAVELTPEDFNADKDPQLDKALELLASPQGFAEAVAAAKSAQAESPEAPKEERK